MKYIKKFENTSYHVGKDYNPKHNGFDMLYQDMELLKKLNISFDLYYYYDTDFKLGVCFKIYTHISLTKEERKLLDSKKFMVESGPYQFTWDWKKIEEKDIPLLIDVKKYNL